MHRILDYKLAKILPLTEDGMLPASTTSTVTPEQGIDGAELTGRAENKDSTLWETIRGKEALVT